MAGIDAALIDEIGYFLSNNAGLPAAGAGQNQEWPIDIAHGLALSGVELGQGSGSYRAWVLWG